MRHLYGHVILSEVGKCVVFSYEAEESVLFIGETDPSTSLRSAQDDISLVRLF